MDKLERAFVSALALLNDAQRERVEQIKSRPYEQREGRLCRQFTFPPLSTDLRYFVDRSDLSRRLLIAELHALDPANG